jgi:hypothetical protein
MKLTLFAAAITAALIAPAPAVLAQGGYRTEEIVELGLEYPCARDFDAIPTEPSEQWIVAQWAEELPKKAKDRKAFRPELRIVWIDRVPDKGPTTPAGDAPPGEGPPPIPDEEEAGGGEGEEPAPEVGKKINSTERYLERYLGSWKPGEKEEGELRDGMQGAVWPLRWEKGGKVNGWMYEYVDPKRVCLFIGFCHEDDAKEQEKIWRYMAEHARFREPEPVDMTKWVRFYEKRPELIDAEYRLKIREQLVRGWEADDTENYIFVFSTKDQKLLQIMKRELEAIRKQYELLFPPTQPVTAVSTVRICKSLDEYHQYGGPQGSGGYWNSAEQELVFFDYDSMDKAGKKKKGKANSRIVLYHEAFHQYIYYSTGELPPHSWFNEGTGDYFSGALISGGKVKKIGVNPWRIETIQEAIRTKDTIPWSEIIRFEQPEYYRRDRVGLCYAQGWSMIYFLREAKAAQKHPVWSQINKDYFDTLKVAYGEELEAAGENPGAQAKWEAGKKARDRAVDAAFADVDFDELEEEWADFILDLKVPR